MGKDFIELIRVKHWIKNFLVFLPLFFSLEYSIENFISVIFAFFSFCLMSSAIYIINDLRDISQDRNHPRKSKRPIASGKIGIRTAMIIIVLLLISSFVLHYFATETIIGPAFYCLLLYMVLNLLYSFGAKNIPILDVVILAAGFVIRVYYGGFVVGVPISHWLFLTVLSGSLFLGLGKRKKELEIKDNIRPVLKSYNEPFLKGFMNVCLSLVIAFYSLWTIEQSNRYLLITIPLFIIIFMQYFMYMEDGEEGDPTTILFSHPLLLLTCFIFILFMISILLFL